MRQISCEEMVNLSDAYTGKQVELSLSPIHFVNTYHHFRLHEEDNVFILYDINSDTQQELIIDKENIDKINYSDGDVFDSTFSIILKDKQGRIDFTVSEEPILCNRCGKIIDTPYEPMWVINQQGEYGSRWDSEKRIVHFCDDCLAEIIGYENEEVNILN